MGIIYYATFLFGVVKHVAKIDEAVDYYKDDYVDTSRRNMISISSPLGFGGECKGALCIYDIQIPENANVICISNTACDDYQFHTYDIVYDNGVTTTKTAYASDNRFMVPVNGHTSFHYRAGPAWCGMVVTYDGKTEGCTTVERRKIFA